MIALLLGGLATVLLLFPVLNQRRRDRLVQQWSGLLVRSCGVRIKIDPAAAAQIDDASRGRMIVANHISWLDIFVINAIAPSCFIAKSDIAAWPLIGTLVGRVGTLFLERGKRHAVHDMIQKAQARLREGRRIAVFPEGTTSDGLRLLPFHGNLIEAAVQTPTGVVPIGLRYQDSRGMTQSGDGGAMNFEGDMTFVASVMRILRGRDVIALVLPLAELRPASLPTSLSDQSPDKLSNQSPDKSPDKSPELGTGASKQRHRLASAARQQLSAALALPLEDNIPEIVRDLRAAPR